MISIAAKESGRMAEYLQIFYPGGSLTLLPGLLPAPAADLRKILKWADESETDAVGILKEWLDLRKEQLQEKYSTYDEQQRNTLQRFFEVSKQRDADRELLKSYQGKERYKLERPIVKENIKDATRRMQDLRVLRADEISMMSSIMREIKQLDRNKELIRQWEEQRKPTSPT